MDAVALVLRARAILTEEEESVHFSREKLTALIPIAVMSLQDEYVRLDKRGKLQYFYEDVAISSISGGSKDISTEVDAGLRLDLIHRAQIKVTYDENPEILTAKVVNSLDRVTGQCVQDPLFVYVYFDGPLMYLSDAAITAATIRGIIAGTSVANVNDLILPDLAKMLAHIAMQEVRTPKSRTRIAAAKLD